MTAVPQRTALSHAFGALRPRSSGTAHYYLFDLRHAPPTSIEMAFLCLEVLLGGLTFTGSMMAFGKLQELLPTRPIVYKNQNIYQPRVARRCAIAVRRRVDRSSAMVLAVPNPAASVARRSACC